jgi:hypothetical protein
VHVARDLVVCDLLLAERANLCTHTSAPTAVNTAIRTTTHDTRKRRTHLLRRHLRALLQHDARTHLLAKLVVRDADDLHVLHCRVCVQEVLHLPVAHTPQTPRRHARRVTETLRHCAVVTSPRVHVLAASDDHVLESTHDATVSLLTVTHNSVSTLTLLGAQSC